MGFDKPRDRVSEDDDTSEERQPRGDGQSQRGKWRRQERASTDAGQFVRGEPEHAQMLSDLSKNGQEDESTTMRLVPWRERAVRRARVRWDREAAFGAVPWRSSRSYVRWWRRRRGNHESKSIFARFRWIRELVNRIYLVQDRHTSFQVWHGLKNPSRTLVFISRIKYEKKKQND